MPRVMPQGGSTQKKDAGRERQPQFGEKPKHGGQQHGGQQRGEQGEGGDPRTLPGSEDLGDQRKPQNKGGMTKGT